MAQLIRFAGNLVLTRLLMPEAFGLMAVVSTLMMGLNLVTDIGSGVAIVESRRGTEHDFIHTAWTLQVLRGVSIWLVALVGSAGLLFAQGRHLLREGTVYDDPRLPAMIVVATFALVITGLGSMNAKLAERRLDLRRASMIDLGSQLAALVVMVAGAALTGSVWALVVGGLVAASLRSMLGHALLPGPRARLRLESQAVRELLGKGKWVALSSLMGFLALNGDRFLLGGLLNATTLGLYSIAFGLASIASAAIAVAFSKVIFPAFSEVVRQRPQDLPAVYRKFQRVADAGIGVLSGFMFVAADVLVVFLYDARYEGAGPILRFLSLCALGYRFLVVEQIYLALGRTWMLAVGYVPRVTLLLVGLPIGFGIGGLTGALVAIVASYFGHWPVAVWFRARQGLGQARNDLVLPAAIALGLLMGWLLTRTAAWLGLY